MIEMFLNVERLSAGQMELKKETLRRRMDSCPHALTACAAAGRAKADTHPHRCGAGRRAPRSATAS